MAISWSPISDFLLESDSSARRDVNLLRSESVAEAETEKHRLEQLQRHDTKLR